MVFPCICLQLLIILFFKNKLKHSIFRYEEKRKNGTQKKKKKKFAWITMKVRGKAVTRKSGSFFTNGGRKDKEETATTEQKKFWYSGTEGTRVKATWEYAARQEQVVVCIKSVTIVPIVCATSRIVVFEFYSRHSHRTIITSCNFLQVSCRDSFF